MSHSIPAEPRNIHGRKPGRGARPWLLLPKLIFVAFYLGGLAATVALWLISRFPALHPSDPKRLWTLNLVGNLLEFFVVPALLLAIIMGLALLLQMPRLFLRMRWMIVKLISLFLLIPASHFYLSSRLALLRQAFLNDTSDPTLERQFTWGLLAALAGSTWIVILARLKPRLGQNWARTYASAIPPKTPEVRE